MSDDTEPKRWWQTLLGALPALAGVIVALTGLVGVLYQAGVLSGSKTLSELPGQHVFRSPDGRYEADRIGSGKDVHYQVREVASQKIMLTTHAEFDTPNDVKAGTFSPESKAFAAVYHYGHEGKYSWIGIWSIESGMLVRRETRPGWTTDISSVFKQ